VAIVVAFVVTACGTPTNVSPSAPDASAAAATTSTDSDATAAAPTAAPTTSGPVGPVVPADVVALEYLMGARSVDDYARLELALGGFRWVETLPADWHRAREVHRALAGQGAGHQRSVRIPDLIIAAIGERADLPIAHFDEDYDRIAAITGQPTRWVMPREAP
jgi:hypothetical protein